MSAILYALFQNPTRYREILEVELNDLKPYPGLPIPPFSTPPIGKLNPGVLVTASSQRRILRELRQLAIRSHFARPPKNKTKEQQQQQQQQNNNNNLGEHVTRENWSHVAFLSTHSSALSNPTVAQWPYCNQQAAFQACLYRPRTINH